MADKVAAAFHEVNSNEPESVKKSGKTGKAKRKMMTAIALSKARAAGAHVPNYVSRDELHMEAGASSGICHASERVPHKKVEEAGSTPGAAAATRRANNQRRDARTKLGRGKPGVIEVE